MSDDSTAVAEWLDRWRAALAEARRIGDQAATRRLNKFRALSYVCSGCGEPILSVILSRPYRCIVGRRQDEPLQVLPVELTGAERARAYLDAAAEDARPPERQESVALIAHAEKEWSEPNTRWSYVCRCRQWEFGGDVIAADLARGVRKRAWSH